MKSVISFTRLIGDVMAPRKKHVADEVRVFAARIFDADYYIEMYPYIKRQEINPLEHFLQFGQYERKVPNGFFEEDAYGTINQNSSPLEMIMNRIRYEGFSPSPSFDSHFYLQKYGDCAPYPSCYEHFICEGMRALNMPNAILDPIWFRYKYDAHHLNTTQILQTVVRNNMQSSPALWSDWYAQKNNLNGKSSYAHFISNRKRSVDSPNPVFGLFDDECKQKPYDVLSDYLTKSNRGGFKLVLFDEFYYSKSNPDLSACKNYLYHFLEHGFFECRPSKKGVSIVKFDKVNHSDDYVVSMGKVLPRDSDSVFDVAGFTYGVFIDSDVELFLDVVSKTGRIDLDVKSMLFNVKNLDRYRVSEKPSPSKQWKHILDLTRPKIVMLLPWIRRGGSDLEAIHVYKALRELYSLKSTEIIIILTDTENMEAIDWLPDDAIVKSLQLETLVSDIETKGQLLAKLLLQLRPEHVINENSHVGWQCYAQHGKALSQYMKLSAMLFCFDYDANNNPVGYTREYLSACLPYLDKVLLDNKTFAQNISETFGFVAADMQKIIPIYYPAPDNRDKRQKLGKTAKGKRVLWAGRFCRQKRVDLLLEIARQNIDTIFDVYGYFYESDSNIEQLLALPNVNFCGSFEIFSDIVSSEHAAFIYTSSWDGLPNIILEALAMDMTVIASDVGGISEVITDRTGWLVRTNSANEFSINLKRIFDDHEEVELRRGAARALLSAQHSWQNFTQNIHKIGIFGN